MRGLSAPLPPRRPVWEISCADYRASVSARPNHRGERMSSKNTDAQVVVLPMEGALDAFMEQLRDIIESQDPKIVYVDRDQRTVAFLPRDIETTTEFTELSLGLLLQQEIIDIKMEEDGVDPHDLLLREMRSTDAQFEIFCAHPSMQATTTRKDKTLWTHTVTQGYLLLICRRPEGTWRVLGTQM